MADGGEGRVRIGILGPLSIRDSDGRQLGGLSPKAAALIAYLALADGHRARRARLAGLLWSRGDTEHAQASLRQLVRQLRQTDSAASWLIADRDEIRLDWSRIDLDYALLEAATICGKAADLRIATAYWRGPLLDGLDLIDDGFVDWLRVTRAQLTDRLTRALHLSLASSGADPAVTSEIGQLLLTIDTCDEEAAAALMRLHLDAGRTVRALRIYEQVGESMARELGVKPGPALRALAERAQSKAVRARPSGIVPSTQLIVRSASGDAAAFVGWRRIDTDTVMHDFPSPRVALEAALELSAAAVNPAQALAIRIANGGDDDIDAMIADACAAIDWCGAGLVLDRDSYAALKNEVPALYIDYGERIPGNPATHCYAVDLGDPDIEMLRSEIGRGTIRAAPALRQRRPIVAIADFVWQGDPGDAAYLAQGLADCVAMTLAQGRWFDVVVKLPGGARSASSDFTVSGELARRGDYIHITLRVIAVGNGRILNTWRYQSTVAALLTLEGDVVRQIIAVLEPDLLEAVWRSLDPAPAHATDAFHCVMRALQFGFRFRAPDLDDSLRLIDRAIASAPDFAKAWACRALAIVLQLYMGWVSDERAMVERSFFAAHRALALDARDPWSRFALGMTHLIVGAPRLAYEELSQAINLNPGFAWAHGALGQSLIFLDRNDEGIAALRLALRLSPRDPLRVYWLVAMALSEFLAGHYQFAHRWARQAAVERPDYPGAQRMLAVTAAAIDEVEEARVALAAMMKLQPSFDEQHLALISPFVNVLHLPTYRNALISLGWKAGVRESLTYEAS